MVEETSDLTGSSWMTSGQYLRAGGGCSSMLIRRKSSTDEEYHHEGIIGDFNVITGANAAVLSSRIFDSFELLQFENGLVDTPWINLGDEMSHHSLISHSGNQFYYASRSLSLNNKAAMAICLAACSNKHLKFLEKLICIGICYGLYGGKGGGGNSGGCPTGSCPYQCSGEKPGCAPPGSIIMCKSGDEIKLSKNCGTKSKKTTSPCTIFPIVMPDPAGGITIGIGCSYRF